MAAVSQSNLQKLLVASDYAATVKEDDNISAIENLSPSDFICAVPWLLWCLDWRGSDWPWHLREEVARLIISRLSTTNPPSLEDPLISEIHSILADSHDSMLQYILLHQILGFLPREHLEVYRDALIHLSRCHSQSDGEQTAAIFSRGSELLRFLDATQAWVPAHKADDLAIRSLEILVHTADDMRPHVVGLLEWLQDPNWPPYDGCWRQLKRFPELTIDPIRDELRKGEDGWWELSLLTFLHRAAPPPMIDKARGEIERIAQCPTQEEIDNDLVELAHECLQQMDDEGERRKILRKITRHRDG
ncbi:hypothetical protein R3P38DRAFT_93106 [Favolaschia claudopus]|uniref:DUF5071 domain-containing protein n=1 Tax=Favolaschia claudopus TaxID=2862362 RepID=A0AAW0D7M9_9AGAR